MVLNANEVPSGFWDGLGLPKLGRIGTGGLMNCSQLHDAEQVGADGYSDNANGAVTPAHKQVGA